MRIMGSLGSVPIPMKPQIYQFAFSNEVRQQDKYRVLLSTVTSAESRSLFWNFLQNNWEDLRRQITNNGTIGMIIKVNGL